MFPARLTLGVAALGAVACRGVAPSPTSGNGPATSSAILRLDRPFDGALGALGEGQTYGAVSADGRVAVVARGGAAAVWDTERGQQVRYEPDVSAVAVSDDGATLLFSGSSTRICPVDLSAPCSTAGVERFASATHVGFTASGKYAWMCLGTKGADGPSVQSVLLAVPDGTLVHETNDCVVAAYDNADGSVSAFSVDDSILDRNVVMHRWEAGAGKPDPPRRTSFPRRRLALRPGRRPSLRTTRDAARPSTRAP